MVHLENSAVINKTVPEVFSLSADFENYPRFLPSVKRVQVLKRRGNCLLIRREGLAGGREVSWTSQVQVKENEWIRSRQIDGPLPGMSIFWRFLEITGGTKVIIAHDFTYRKVPLLGELIARIVAIKVVGPMAEETLEAIKKQIGG